MTGRSTILVVEDEALIADDIQRTLSRLGYDVPPPTATGHEAIDTAGRLRPQLVLMDIKLQGPMDGIEAALAIRRQYEIPVVFLTSYSDDATLARAMETAPSGYLIKPFSDRELRTAIEVALHKHQLETRLADRERWFSTTLRSIGDAVIATDPKETITFMNATAELLTGWQNGEAIGRPLDEVFHLVGPTGAPVPSPIQLAFQQNFAVQLPADTGLVVRTGGQVEVDDSAAPITDEKGNVLGGVVVFRDVTGRKKLERRLAQSERLASLGTMAAGMGHEINNPLAAIMGNVTYASDVVQVLRKQLERFNLAPEKSDVIVEAIKDIGEVVEALADANSAADRVRRIVHNLKKFASVEGDTRTVLDLPNVLDGAAKMTLNAIRHHARLSKEYGTTPYVEASEGQLTQVFTNLLVNAAQAIQDGQAEHHEIRLVTYTDAAGRAVAEVRDTGAGIPAHVLPRIFDPFFTTKNVGEGMGLGLAISHNIIMALGGDITVESNPGQGTVFRVAIPGAMSRMLPVDAALPEEAPARRGKVLVVDDELDVARSLERVLRKYHDVTVTTSGPEALAAIAAVGCYDVVFCDLMMPNISGMELYDSLLTVNPEQARRVVFMTGGAFTQRARAFLESTSNVHILKPFEPEAVRSIANDYVKQRPSVPRR
jgi:two-component system cell cycle sensor histidine kinase/response regulator CckA